jgi:hypothetical protein
MSYTEQDASPSAAPALLLGLGARILLDKFIRSLEPSLRDFVLLGVWQGVGLHYGSRNSDLILAITVGIAAKLLIEFILVRDATKCASTLLGVALGVLTTDFSSLFLNSHYNRQNSSVHSHAESVHASQRRQRLVQFRQNIEGDGSELLRLREFRQTLSDITSVHSNSELIGPNPSMTPLDREVAALRARASLADSERRRFKEEKKWALSQGNFARASQMSWQVKRYHALMRSFHREADARAIEGMLNYCNAS